MRGTEYLSSRVLFGMKAGLENITALCDRLGNPQHGMAAVHVVGTNGKGSTAYYLSGILHAHGVRTGLFTSPHLVSVRERIRIDDRCIPTEELDRLLCEVQTAAVEIGIEPTFFEVLTAVALRWFAQNQVRAVVLEAGLGGRLDSTNVVDSQLVVLTSIALEHTEHLGNTTALILNEKLGVLRPGAGLILGRLEPELERLAREHAAVQGSIVYNTPVPDANLRVANAGDLYRENAALAWEAAHLFLNGRFSRPTALFALQDRSWAGRMQLLHGPARAVDFILDGAHNPHAIQALATTLTRVFPGRRFPCVFAALGDKDVETMVRLLSPYVSQWHCTRTAHPKMRDPAELVQLCERLGTAPASIMEWEAQPATQLRAMRAPQTPVLVAGSLYLVGNVVAALRDQYEELRPFRELEVFTNEYR